MIDLTKKIDLLPDIFDKSASPKSYIRKKFEVIADIFQEIIDVAAQLSTIDDVTQCTGATLDLWGADFGIKRNGLSDADFLTVILARIFNLIIGNNVEKTLRYLGYTFTNYRYLDMWGSEITAFNSGVPLWRAFDIEIYDTLTDDQKGIILNALNYLKAAGIRAELNYLENKLLLETGSYILAENSDRILL